MAIDAVARSLIKSDMDATGFVRGAEQMAAAADKASTATERLTTQTERTKRTASESGGAFERLRAKYDEAFAAVRKIEQANAAYERAVKTVNAAVERGHVTQQTANAVLEKAKSALLGVATAAEKAAAAQAKINAATGVKTTTEEDYKKRAADIAAYGAELDRLKGKFNPLWAAGQKYKEVLKEIAQAEKLGAISAKEAAAARAGTKEEFASYVRKMGEVDESGKKVRNSFGLLGYETKNLRAQFIDLGVSVASGGGLLYPIIQQGPQIFEVFGSWSKMGAAAARAIAFIATPAVAATAAVGALAVGIGVLINQAEQEDRAIRSMQNRLQGLRDDYRAAAQAANDAAKDFAQSSQFSVGDTRQANQILLSVRTFSGARADLLAMDRTLGDVAAKMGITLPEAAKLMADAMRDPAAVAARLSEEGLQTLNPALVRQIELMQRAGDRAGAFALTLRGIRDASRAAAENRTELERLFEELGNRAEALSRRLDPVREVLLQIANTGLRGLNNLLGANDNQGPGAEGSGGVTDTPQSRIDAALRQAGQRGSRYDSAANLRAETQQYATALRELQARGEGASESARRLRAAMGAVGEEMRGLVGPVEQYLRGLRNQTELSGVTEGAMRDLAQAEQGAREAGGGAAAQAEARRIVQQRLTNELEEYTQQTNRSITVTLREAEATAQGARAASDAAIAAQAEVDARKYAVAGTEEHARAVEKLVYWRTLDREARQLLRDAQAQRDQALQIELLQRETDLLGESVAYREREMAAARELQRIEREGGDRNALTEAQQERIAAARAIADANTNLEQQRDLYNELSNFGTQAFDRIGSAITEAFANGSISAIKFKDIGKAVLSELIQLALRLSVINPLANAVAGTNRGTIYSLGAGAAASRATTATTSSGNDMATTLSTASAGRTLLSSWPSYADGSVTGGVGSIYAPGYQANTGFGLVDSAANYNVYGGISGLQAGAGALSIAGGAYGVYSGLQTGGARGYTQAAGGAVGMAGGAAGLAVASGATATGGMLAGAAGTAIAATAAWAPYVAAALIIASMLMPGPKQSNAAAGANINLSTGVVNLENSGKETGATSEARDQMVTLIKDTSDQLSKLLGVTASGVIGFELGQRDPSRVVLNGQQIGTAGVGDTQKLADILGKAILQSFSQAPGVIEVQKRILDASGGNVDFAIQLLQQTKSIADAYGSDALNPDRNPVTRAIYDAAVQTGNIDTVVAALKGAAELTAAYGDALNTAEAIQVVQRGGANLEKIASDLQWLFEVYKPLTGATEQISALDQAIAASNRTYSDAIARATDLGLATDVLATKQQEAAEKIRQSLRDSYDALMREATGGSAVTQAVGTATAIRGNWNANALDYLKVGKDPNALYAAQMTAAFKELDIATLEQVVVELKGLDEVAALFAQAALDAAKATAKNNAAASYDAQLREATGAGWVNQILELSNTIAANADAYREAGKDPALLYAEQVKAIINGLDADALANAAQYLQGLDGVAQEFLSAAIQTAQAAQQLAAAAQIAADAADYDAKLRAAMGLDLVNTIVSIRKEIDAMAARYTAAGKDPNVLYTAQVNAALAGQDTATLAKTAAGLQGLDAAAASLTTAALQQSIAAEVAAAQQAVAAAEAAAAAQAQQDAAAAAAQAQQDAAQAAQDAAQAAQDAASAQEQAAQEAAQAAQQLAQAGQSIKDWISGIKSSEAAGFSPTQRLTNAQSTYNADLALAQQGNLDALNRITSSADALIQAGKDMYGSGAQFVALRDSIIAQLTALPAVQSADQQIIDQLSGVNTRLDTANTRINTTNSAISTSNSSLSGISSNTTTANAELAAAKALLQSIDTNNDGIVTIEEIQAAAQAKITAAQSALTTAAQSTATNTGATTTAIGGTVTAVNNNTAKADEVKGEITSNNAISLQIQQLNETLTAAATSSSGGFMALGAMLLDANHRHAAIAFNTKNSRPASTVDGVEWAANGLAFARLGIPDIVSSPTIAPMVGFGEAGPEAIMPLDRGPDGRLGVRMLGGANDNSEVVGLLRAILADRQAGRRQSAKQAAAVERRLAALEAGIGGMAAPLKRVAAR